MSGGLMGARVEAGLRLSPDCGREGDSGWAGIRPVGPGPGELGRDRAGYAGIRPGTPGPGWARRDPAG